MLKYLSYTACRTGCLLNFAKIGVDFSLAM